MAPRGFVPLAVIHMGLIGLSAFSNIGWRCTCARARRRSRRIWNTSRILLVVAIGVVSIHSINGSCSRSGSRALNGLGCTTLCPSCSTPLLSSRCVVWITTCALLSAPLALGVAWPSSPSIIETSIWVGTRLSTFVPVPILVDVSAGGAFAVVRRRLGNCRAWFARESVSVVLR